MRAILTALLLSLAAHAAAADSFDTELKRLQTILSIMNQELQAEYQQMRSIQETLRSNVLTPPNLQAGYQGDVVRYDDFVAEQRNAARRDAALRSQLDTIHERVKQIEAEKQPILDRLKELVKAAPPPPPPAGEAPPGGANAAAPAAAPAAPAYQAPAAPRGSAATPAPAPAR
jgi:predicted  nucleic acid-binding Zn-ribbon protein